MEYVTVGGILALAARHYKDINGFSNTFYGWGGEDNDLSIRWVYRNECGLNDFQKVNWFCSHTRM